ncbi:MAG TPA: cobalamin-dependent protein [Syntrophorhabdales bacterium]|nr:cobalamin-dependent protein [Syntrophorhabdales bacterium]
MKVLLVQPPVEDFYDTSIRTYPLNLLYLAAKIRDRCDVSVADLRTGKRRMLAFPGEYEDLAPFYRVEAETPFSLFRRYHRFGATKDEIRKIIEDGAPSVVGISASYTTYSLEALEVAKIAKEVDRNIITILGGTHATLFPAHLLAHSFVDYVIRGEGETPLARLMERLHNGDHLRSDPISGVSFRRNGHFRISGINIEEEIDLLPDRSRIPAQKYRINKRRYTFFLTSRGCPFNCSFCGKPPVPYRKRKLAGIEKELTECIDLGIEAIDFEDDMLNLDRYFFTEVLNLLRGKRLTLSAMNGIYPETVDIPLLESMHAAGFRRLNFSLVDVRESILKSQARTLPKAFLEMLPWLESSPFLVETHFIIGLPGQEPEDVIETLLFLMGKRLLLGPSVFYLAPGSDAFRDIVGDEWEPYIKLMRSSALFPANNLFTREITYTLMKLVRFINYMKQAIDLSSEHSDREGEAGYPRAGVSEIGRSGDVGALSDILKAPPETKAHDREIVRRLLVEKRFTCYDVREERFVDEPHDSALVKFFFEKARGLTIKGFKTDGSANVDV